MSSFVTCVAACLFAASVACGRGPDSSTPIPHTNEAAGPPSRVLALPKRPGSLRFAVIGDSGRGHKPQYEIAAQMAAFREEFEFEFVLMLGDNVYDGGTREDYLQKFELPYKPFLDDGVKFYAVIGNHDDPNQPSYPPFNMGGKRYYTFRPKIPAVGTVLGVEVQFFMIDTELLDAPELRWIEREMAASDADWKIPVFHRPIYTSGRYGNPARILRAALEPIFLRHGVRVAMSGHEHFYERTHPQNGITYFVSGAAGSLRANDMRTSRLTAKGFDTDYSFMLFEITDEEMYFQAISRTGHSVDAGTIKRR